MYGILRGHDASSSTFKPSSAIPSRTWTASPEQAGAQRHRGRGIQNHRLVISQEPDVILINKIEDTRSAMELIKYSKTEGGRRVYVGIRANSTFESSRPVAQIGGRRQRRGGKPADGHQRPRPPEAVHGLQGRVRPDQAMLRKLGMNPDKVTKLFQARTQPLRDQKGNPVACEFCHDLRFKGRQGVFEIMTVDEEMRPPLRRKTG